MGWYRHNLLIGGVWINPDDPDKDYWTTPAFSEWEEFGMLF